MPGKFYRLPKKEDKYDKKVEELLNPKSNKSPPMKHDDYMDSIGEKKNSSYGGKKSKKAKPKKKSRTRKAKPTQTKMPQKRIKSLIKKEKKQQNDIYLNSEPSLLKIKERNLKNATFKKNTKWEKYPSYTSLMTQVQ